MYQSKKEPQPIELQTISNVPELGAYIRERRKQYGVSQRTISDLCKVNRSAISRLERGKLEWVSIATVLKILNALNVTMKLPTHTSV